MGMILLFFERKLSFKRLVKKTRTIFPVIIKVFEIGLENFAKDK